MQRFAGKLSLLMPAYNEEERIFENALETSRIGAELAESYEVLIINDGSTDETSAEVQRAVRQDDHIRLIDSPQNNGKGAALCLGTAEAEGDLIAFCDADLDLNPAQLSDFLDRMQKENADVVIGSKMHPESKVDYPFIRRVYSWGYYLFLLLLFRLHTQDTQTGLKLFKAEVIKPVMQRVLVKRFAFDIEVLAIINSRGYKIVSAPVEVHFQREAFGRIGLADIRNMVVDTLAVFYRLYILHYYDRPSPEDAQENQEPSSSLHE